MPVDVPRPAYVICGMNTDGHATCIRDLWRTYGPAGSLWCEKHGHVLDVFPSPPLSGVAHLNFGDIEKNGWVRL